MTALKAVPYLLAVQLSAQVNVLTANYGNERTNANLQETVLSPSTVNPDSFGKLGTFPVDGQIYAQPLYVSGLAMDGGQKNVVFVVTMHNSVYAIDADNAIDAKPLWHVNLGPSVASSFLNLHDIVPEVGTLSTPAIDLKQGVIYVVADVTNQGAPAFQLHALGLTDGREMMYGPVTVSAKVAGHGDGSLDGVLRFDASQHLQRPGLLLSSGNVYLAFGSHSDLYPWHGWLMAYDASDLRRQTAVFCSTPDGSGGSIWQSGRAPAEQSGNIYVGTANGDFDGQTNFANGFLSLSSELKLIDWFVPDDWQLLSDYDYDMGSAGPALVPGTNLIVGGDKFGNLYLIDRDNMGHLGPDNSPSAQTFLAAQYGGIYNYAMWPSDSGLFLYMQEEGLTVKAYRIRNGMFDTTPAFESTVPADIPFNGFTVSANGGQDGILWMTEGDHTTASVPGTLHAFDALTLAELWNSKMNPKRDPLGRFAKFAQPTVANGKVFVPTFSNEVAIYGLLDDPSATSGPHISFIASLASYEADAVSPGEVVSIAGIQIGPDQAVNGQAEEPGVLPTTVADTQVLFDGTAAPLLYVSANEIRAVIPFGVAGPATQIQVVYQGSTSDPFSIAVQPVTPALFSADGTGTGQALATNQDGTDNSADNPALAGSLLTLRATGFGRTDPPGADGTIARPPLPVPQLPVTVLIGGQPADVLYAGATPGAIAGLMQITLVIPAATSSGPMVPIIVLAGDLPSANGITVSVR